MGTGKNLQDEYNKNICCILDAMNITIRRSSVVQRLSI